jgi:hypothetical protein
MAKKKEKKYDLTPNVTGLIKPKESDEYIVNVDGGLGINHEYTISVLETVSGTLYTISYSENSCWSEHIQGEIFSQILNTQENYEFLKGSFPSSNCDYNDMFVYMLFFRLISKLESKPQFTYEVFKKQPLIKDNF